MTYVAINRDYYKNLDKLVTKPISGKYANINGNNIYFEPGTEYQVGIGGKNSSLNIRALNALEHKILSNSSKTGSLGIRCMCDNNLFLNNWFYNQIKVSDVDIINTYLDKNCKVIDESQQYNTFIDAFTVCGISYNSKIRPDNGGVYTCVGLFKHALLDSNPIVAVMTDDFGGYFLIDLKGISPFLASIPEVKPISSEYTSVADRLESKTASDFVLSDVIKVKQKAIKRVKLDFSCKKSRLFINY